MKKGEIRLELHEDNEISAEKRYVFIKSPEDARKLYFDLMEQLDKLQKA